MTSTHDLTPPLAALIDRIVADPAARDAAKLALIGLAEDDLAELRVRLAAAAAPDVWIDRARPTFLYVMYALLLWAMPMGLLAAFRPQMAQDVARGIAAYLNAIPEPLYALFGTGYLGYTVARSWAKAKGVER